MQQQPKRADVRWEWIGEGWEMYQKQMGNWILISLVGFILSLIPTVPVIFFMLASMRGNSDPQDLMSVLRASGVSVLTQIIAGVISWVTQAFTYSGYYNVAFKQLKGEEISLSDFFGGLQYFIPSLAVSALIGIFILIGNFFCCLGFIFQLLTIGIVLFTYPFIVERKLNPIEALKESANISMRNIVMFTLFAIVAHIVGLSGALLCGVGVILTLPILFCTVACAYRDCTGLPSAMNNDSYSPPPPPNYGGYEPPPPPPPSSWQ
jgi:hypothetical protein